MAITRDLKALNPFPEDNDMSSVEGESTSTSTGTMDGGQWAASLFFVVVHGDLFFSAIAIGRVLLQRFRKNCPCFWSRSKLEINTLVINNSLLRNTQYLVALRFAGRSCHTHDSIHDSIHETAATPSVSLAAVVTRTLL